MTELSAVEKFELFNQMQVIETISLISKNYKKDNLEEVANIIDLMSIFIMLDIKTQLNIDIGNDEDLRKSLVGLIREIHALVEKSKFFEECDISNKISELLRNQK